MKPEAGRGDQVKRFPVGSKVFVMQEPGGKSGQKLATVVKHGRDSANIYTEVEYEDGTRERVHRDYIVGKKTVSEQFLAEIAEGNRILLRDANLASAANFGALVIENLCYPSIAYAYAVLAADAALTAVPELRAGGTK